MKFDHSTIAPSGKRVALIRLGTDEAVIIRGLVAKALRYMPKTPETEKTTAQLQAMSRCLNSALVAQWIEHGDSTPANEGSIPSESTK